jgi:hypothetical protein
MVLEGTYEVRLTLEDRSLRQSFEIVPDPRGVQSREDRRAQYDLLVKISEKISLANETVNQIRDVKGQLDAWETRLKDQEDAGEIVRSARELNKALTEIEEALFKTEPKTDLHYTEKLKLSGRMAALKFAVDFTDYAPTTQAVQVYESLAGRIDEQVQRFRQRMEIDLAELNEQIQALRTPTIAPRPTKSEEKEPVAAS